jgi:ABC-type bacteriocin/lantibiotic exporter with double-glycine peptidase domain
MRRNANASTHVGGLLQRFPALGRLGSRHRRRRIPVILQLNIVECAAASLAMVLGYHGKRIPLHEVRDGIGVDREGANALAILHTARHHGLRARGVQLEIEELECLPEASIMHWEFNHFIVFERYLGDAIQVVDPAIGRRRIPIEQVRKAFTGVALLFEPSDAFQPRGPAHRPVWRYLRRALLEGGRWGRIVATSLAVQLFALAIPVLMAVVVDRVVPRGDWHLLFVLVAGLFGIVVFNFVASMTRAHLLLEMRTQLDVQMALGFLEHMVGLPFEFFQRRSTGDILMRLSSNTNVREILTTGTLSALLDGSLVCVYLVVLLLFHPLMAGVVFLLGLAQIATFGATRARRAELMAENLHVQSRSASYQVEILTGMEALKSMGSEQRAVEHWTDLFVDCQNVAVERGRLSALLDSIMSSLRLGSPLIILAIGAVLVLRGGLSLGAMLGLNALAVGFLLPLAALIGTVEQFELLGSYMGRLDDVFGSTPEQDDAKVVAPHVLSGRIGLEHVSFRYGDRSPMVVKDVSIDLEPGQCVAIVGPSGCGKTTLASLMLALYRPVSGRILYDRQDLAGLDVRAVRRQLGVVIQRPYIFGATVRQNIALSDPTLPLDDVIRAAKLAQIHDEITAMSMGYETLVSDSALSGGQRQRISIARALVRRASIMLLDEATSSLDAVTESKVRSAIDALGCTRIIIAHRLSTIVHADLILVMRDGAIVERGTHSQLLVMRGAYWDLVTAQLEQDAAAPRLVG